MEAGGLYNALKRLCDYDLIRLCYLLRKLVTHIAISGSILNGPVLLDTKENPLLSLDYKGPVLLYKKQ